MKNVLGQEIIAVTCNLCGSTDHNPLFEKDSYRIVCCRACGLTFVNPRKKQVLEIYDEDYYKGGNWYQDYVGNGPNYLRSFRERFAVISKWLKSRSRILDVGCAYGYFLEVAKQAGHQVEGLEVNKYMVENVVKRLSIPCHHILDFNTFEPAHLYDCVTMFDTIEHLEDPKGVLHRINGLLEKNGMLVLTTPNIRSWLSRLMGRHWPHVTPEEHIYYFDKSTMESLLRETGFEIVHISAVSYRFRLREFVPKFKAISTLLYRVFSTLQGRIPSIFEKSVTLNLGDLFVMARKIESKG